MRRFRLVFVLGALVPGACQPLPHPFETAHFAPTSELLDLPEVVGITVDPVRGVPDQNAGLLRASLTKALQDADIPAGTTGNSHSYHISGTAACLPAGNGRVAAEIDWSILAADGDEIARDRQRFIVDQASWQNGGEALAPAMNAEAARLADALHLPAAAPPPVVPPTPPPLRVVVEAGAGAPGDGDQSLPRALAYVMESAGVSVLDQPDGSAPLVAAKVTVKPVAGAQQDVKIVWTVTNAGGKSIGTVSQENTVPAGSLDGAWSDAAAAVAGAAGDSVRGLVAQAMQPRHIPE